MNNPTSLTSALFLFLFFVVGLATLAGIYNTKSAGARLGVIAAGFALAAFIAVTMLY